MILRLRSLLDTLSLHYSRQQVLIVTHEVVIMCMRYLLEELDEATILDIGTQGDIANCAITEYQFEQPIVHEKGRLQLIRFNFTAPLERGDASVTSASDAKVWIL